MSDLTSQLLSGSQDLLTRFHLASLYQRYVQPYNPSPDELAQAAKQRSYADRGSTAPPSLTPGVAPQTGSRQMPEHFLEYIRDLPGTTNLSFEPSTYLRDLVFQPSGEPVPLVPLDAGNLVNQFLTHTGPLTGGPPDASFDLGHPTTTSTGKPTLVISRSLFETEPGLPMPGEDGMGEDAGLVDPYSGYGYEDLEAGEKHKKKKKKKHRHGHEHDYDQDYEYEYVDDNSEIRRKKKRKREKSHEPTGREPSDDIEHP
ncbi:hypothetical protein IWQ61_008553 [Dispira simplex]|nr:hypothetical protein IWQ61_008553 [Dispira simplex]